MEKPIRVSAIIKVTENCNYDCDFCYYAKNNYDSKKNLSINLCKEIIRKTSDYNYLNGVKNTNIIFHGGEPLLRGLNFFNKILDYEQELIYRSNNERTFDNTVQTNASLINDEWITLFKKYKFNVGISLDGDKSLNYHLSKKLSNNISNIISTYLKMKKIGINVGVLSVITESHTKNVRRFYEFIVNNEIEKIGILPCINDDNNYTVNVDNLSRFMIELFDLYFYGRTKIMIREFTNVIERALGYNRVRSCANCGRLSCGTFLTYDSNGNVFFCDKAYDKTKIIANIKNNSIESIFKTNKYIDEKERCMQFYKNTCIDCKVRHLCNGSCYRNDVVSKEGIIVNRFCEVYKNVYSHIENVVNQYRR